MKKNALLAALLALLILTGCQRQQPDTQLPEPEVMEETPEAAQETPEQTSEQPTEREEIPDLSTPETARTEQERQALDARLFYATVCTCRMEDSARWHLRALGIEADAPSEDFSAAMEVFERALCAYSEDTFMDDAFWLIDTKRYGLELQFWKYDAGGHPDRLSCTAAFYWEPGMEDAGLLGEDLLLYTLDWAPCAEDASEEARTRLQEQYEQRLRDFSSGTGWRASLAPDGDLALTALDPENGASIYYAHDTMRGAMLFREEDLPAVTNDEAFRALAGVAFDESVMKVEGQTLLRGFLASALYSEEAEDFLPWDGPRPVFSFDDIRLAYDLKNAFRPFLNELRADEAARAAFLTSGPWTLFYDGGAQFHLANEAGEEIALSAPLP